jgi:hypothetical protein
MNFSYENKSNFFDMNENQKGLFYTGTARSARNHSSNCDKLREITISLQKGSIVTEENVRQLLDLALLFELKNVDYESQLEYYRKRFGSEKSHYELKEENTSLKKEKESYNRLIDKRNDEIEGLKLRLSPPSDYLASKESGLAINRVETNPYVKPINRDDPRLIDLFEEKDLEIKILNKKYLELYQKMGYFLDRKHKIVPELDVPKEPIVSPGDSCDNQCRQKEINEELLIHVNSIRSPAHSEQESERIRSLRTRISQLCIDGLIMESLCKKQDSIIEKLEDKVFEARCALDKFNGDRNITDEISI